MIDDPLRIISAHEGVFLYGEAISAGYKDKHIRAKRLSGEWHRVRHGAYCFGDDWSHMTERERHRVRACAVRRTTPGHFAFSHVTAAVLHGLDVWGVDLSVVHLTRLDDGPARRQHDVLHHVGALSEDEVSEVGGFLVTNVARAVVETTFVTGVESGLVTADSGLHHGRCHPDELWELFDRFDHWPGSQPAQLTLRLMDGRAESAGESRSRYLFWRNGIPAPDLQWEVRDEHGIFVARTDFVWRKHKLFGEFDGKEKYLRPFRAGDNSGDVVFREKQREDEVRRLTNYACFRLVWADLDHPAQTSRTLLRMMRRAA
jgi:hypothetical protein